MRARRALADAQRAGDLLVGPALGDQDQDLPFPVGERVHRRRRAGRAAHASAARDRRVQLHLAAVGGPHGGDLVGLGILEQVPGRPGLQGAWTLSAWMKLVSATTSSLGWRWVMAAVAATPSMRGIRMSISTTSGGRPAATSAATCSRADSTAMGLATGSYQVTSVAVSVPVGGRGASRRVACKARSRWGGRVRLSPQPPRSDHRSGGTTCAQIRSTAAIQDPSSTSSPTAKACRCGRADGRQRQRQRGLRGAGGRCPSGAHAVGSPGRTPAAHWPAAGSDPLPWLLPSEVMASGEVVKPDPRLSCRRLLRDLARLGNRRPVPGSQRRRRDAMQHHREQDRPCDSLQQHRPAAPLDLLQGKQGEHDRGQPARGRTSP